MCTIPPTGEPRLTIEYSDTPVSDPARPLNVVLQFTGLGLSVLYVEKSLVEGKVQKRSLALRYSDVTKDESNAKGYRIIWPSYAFCRLCIGEKETYYLLETYYFYFMRGTADAKLSAAGRRFHEKSEGGQIR